jgi:hypothetical protein
MEVKECLQNVFLVRGESVKDDSRTYPSLLSLHHASTVIDPNLKPPRERIQERDADTRSVPERGNFLGFEVESTICGGRRKRSRRR